MVGSVTQGGAGRPNAADAATDQQNGQQQQQQQAEEPVGAAATKEVTYAYNVETNVEDQVLPRVPAADASAGNDDAYQAAASQEYLSRRRLASSSPGNGGAGVTAVAPSATSSPCPDSDVTVVTRRQFLVPTGGWVGWVWMCDSKQAGWTTVPGLLHC